MGQDVSVRKHAQLLVQRCETNCLVLMDELGSCTRIDVLKKILKTHFFQCSLFILVFSQFQVQFYFAIVDMYVLIVIVFL